MGRSYKGLLAAALLGFGLMLAAHSASTATPSQPYQWTSALFGGGGFVDGLIFHPKARGLLYARTDVGGAYRWDAAARRWIALNDDLGRDDNQLMGALSLALDPNDPQRVYIAAGEYTASWARTAALLASEDQGASWRRVDLPFKLGGNQDGRSTGERLQVDPNQGSILFLGSTGDGLWKSADRGKTWRRVTGFKPAALTLVLLDAASGKPGSPTPVLYAGTADTQGPSLWRSRDAGETWEPVAGAPAALMPHHAAIDADGVLYASFSNGPGPNGVTDGGVWKLQPATGAWTDITPEKPSAAMPFGYAGLDIDAQHRGVLVVSTLDRWSSGDDIYRSSDGGAHWTAIGAKASHHAEATPWFAAYSGDKPAMGHWIGEVKIDPFDPADAVYGTGYGLWRTGNLTDADAGKGVDWRFDVAGLEETVPQDLASPPAGAQLLVTLADVGGIAYDQFDASPASGFFLPNHETDRSVDVAQLNPSYMVRTDDSAATGGFWSTDGGASWRPFDTSPRLAKGADGHDHNAGRIAISAKGGFLVWAPEHQSAYASNDHGKTWVAATGWPQAPDQTFAPVADRAIEGVFYVHDQTRGDLYISVDGGRSFQKLVSGLPSGGGMLRAVAGRMRDLWLPTPKGLFHSASPADGFKNTPKVNEAYAVGLGAPAPGHDYPAVFLWGRIGETTGLFRSDDIGVTWMRINDDHHQFGWISSLTGDPRVYGRVYLATGGRGVIIGDPAPAR